MTLSSQITPVTLERYEKKYIIHPSLVEPISKFASIYCSLDKYSEASDDKFYQVNNLYFDSPQYTFLQNRINEAETRFNLRIRSYGDNPTPPFFCEIKQKRGGYIRKYRGKLESEHWIDDLTDSTSEAINRQDQAKNVRLFKKLLHSYNASPKVLTNYRRKAYISNHEEYARLTFDIELKYMEQINYELAPIDHLMTFYDHQLNFDIGASVILELKCYTTHVPFWMIDLVRYFELAQTGFSKYATGVIEVLELYVNKNSPRVGLN